jgi:Ran GTPase-activating protein (RanGAP) involved in mRNA processing and transport
MDMQEEQRQDNGRKYLESYGLTDNKMKSLNLFLQGHRVGPQGIVDISKGLVENFSLTALELRRQEIGKDGALSLGQALSHNRYLRYLGLGRNKLLNDGCISIMEGLRQNQTLEFLDLEWNEIRDEGAVAIGEMLRFNNSLQSFVLERNKIKTRGALAIAEALKHNQKLRNLNIGYNKVTTAGAIAFAEALKVNEILITLNLYANEIRKEGGIALAEALQVNPSLQSLNLQSNRITDAVVNLCDVLKENNTVRELNLQNTLLDEDICQRMSDGLLTNQSLMSINFAGNPFGNCGVKFLLNALKGKTALRYLDISDCGIAGLDAVEDICELIELGGNLQILQLDDNKLGRQGVIQLCTRLERNTAIHSINLDRTNMAREGALALAIALKKKSYWLSLSIAGNKIGNDGIKNVLTAIAGMTTVNELDLSDNDITSVCEEALYRALKSNPDLHFVRLKDNPIARNLPSGVLSREMAEQLHGVPEAAALRNSLHGAADAQAQDSSRPEGFLPDLTGPHPNPHNILSKAGPYKPSHNFAPQRRSFQEQESGADAIDRFMHTPSPAPSPGPGPVYSMSSPATSYMSHSRVSLPRSVTPTMGGSVVRKSTTPTAQNMAKAGLSPAGFAGALSPIRSVYTHTALRKLETNVGGLLISDDQLRRKFNQLDTNGNGWLDVREFKHLFLQSENFGVEYEDWEVNEILTKNNMWGDGKITYDEFCILMLGIAQR